MRRRERCLADEGIDFGGGQLAVGVDAPLVLELRIRPSGFALLQKPLSSQTMLVRFSQMTCSKFIAVPEITQATVHDWVRQAAGDAAATARHVSRGHFHRCSAAQQTPCCGNWRTMLHNVHKEHCRRPLLCSGTRGAGREERGRGGQWEGGHLLATIPLSRSPGSAPRVRWGCACCTQMSSRSSHSSPAPPWARVVATGPPQWMADSTEVLAALTRRLCVEADRLPRSHT